MTDVFYIGGTKNGALLGEALVICKEELKKDFRYLIKQRGALMAKGFVLGIQFEALLENGLYFELGSHANRMAKRLSEALKQYGYDFYVPPCSNQLFPVLPNDLLEKMSESFIYSIQTKLDEKTSVIRLVTSWATTVEQVEEFRSFLKKGIDK